jgi:hypothetical protein
MKTLNYGGYYSESFTIERFLDVLNNYNGMFIIERCLNILKIIDIVMLL